MTKKNSAFTVQGDLNGMFAKKQEEPKKSGGVPLLKALEVVTRNMKTTGYRPRTISDYTLHVKHFAEITGAETLEELEASHIYDWLASMNVSNQTKLTRLKCLKAFLGRCFDSGWLQSNFWRAIVIRVDSAVKQGSSAKDIAMLLQILDLSDFVQFRDATAILLMSQTGLRVSTVAQLDASHIDIPQKLLKVGGSLLKNHQQMFLPISDELARMLEVLLQQNEQVRRHYGVSNSLVFITKYGGSIASSPTNNNIQKRLNKYAREYGLKNINPQALRRGFAKSLLDKGAHIALISKALGHGDIEVTTRYLYLDKEDVAENLRDYL
ncbi:tyrosine-type recombinase/integrase [Planococcus halocryophilus]|uniref:tyrosine-type recombinase/integrase n=1 Tax=Planococcus halocryophilus TaxID=1215089 RepID=UPI001F0E59A3|nr:site-specific integrase [Planococcus halocryophilus]MCH4827824.1 site-specific integrase [Planococcus halocryophilus]